MSLSPVILIPGFTGVRLKSILSDGSPIDTWLNFEIMGQAARPGSPIEPTESWLSQMMMSADGSTPALHPEHNRACTGLDAISELDPRPPHAAQTRYFYDLIATLRSIGYDGSTLVAATYDWRVPPRGLEQHFSYFSELREGIEQLCSTSGQPVTLLGHSLGNRVVQYFLAALSTDPEAGQRWIDKHIERYIAISALWLGVPKSIREALTGADGLGLWRINGLRELYQSFGSLAWMIPLDSDGYRDFNTDAFAFLESDDGPLSVGEALALGAPRTAGYLDDYFANDPNYTPAGNPLGTLAMEAPPVRNLVVLHATGQPTEIGAYYTHGTDRLEVDTSATTTNAQFEVKDGVRFETASRTLQSIDQTINSGDGFLPYGSLRFFTTWPTPRGRNVESKMYPGRTHYNVLSDDLFLNDITAILSDRPT